jgi:TolB-like protein/Tfp pilus assembly protein PilF
MAFPLPDKPSVAVLPFDNMSGDSEQEYIADGITENIISALSKISEMFVIARNSTFMYKGSPVKVQKVAEELGVRYVLEGSVQKSGNRVRVTAQLVDAIKGHHLWAEQYDRAIIDFFDLLDEISKEIAVALQMELTHGEQARIWHRSTSNFKAWGHAVKGYSLFLRFTKEDNAKARQLFKQALELDPEYAFAWTFLAWTYIVDVRFGYSDSPAEDIKRGIEIAHKATEIDDTLPDIHSFWNTVYMIRKELDKALESGVRAITLGPNDPNSHVLLAQTKIYNGNFDEAIGLVKKANRLTPYYPAWHLAILGWAQTMARRYEQAIATLDQLLKRAGKGEFSPFMVHYRLAQVYIEIGQEEKARIHAEKILQINPTFSLENYRKARDFYRDPIHLERVFLALRKAGLPDKPPLELPDKPSIAVLAFDNLSGDPEQEYFSDGIAENIITALSKVGELFVIARNSSFTYKGKPVKVQQISRELGVRYILEGSVQKSGDRVRITAQLIDAKNGQHVWAERYDRVLKDIFAIQDDITKRVVSSLQANLTVGEITRAYARGTNSLEAYLKVVKARNIHMRFTKDDNLISRDLTQEAISIDPGYGEAYVLLAATYMLETYFGSDKSPKELMGQAIGNAKKAVELETVGGHAILGWLYSLIGQIDKALTECKIAVDLAPNSASARTWYGAVLTKAGQYDMAVQELEQALRRDPMAGTWVLRFLGCAYSLNDRHGDAISTLKKAIQKAPKDYLSRLLLTRAYVFAGRSDEAQAEAAEVLRINPDFSLEKHAKRFKAKDTELTINALRQAGLK